MIDRAPVTDTPFTPGIGVTLDTADPSQLGDSVPGWQVEYLQLGQGRFHGRITLAQTARMQVLTKDWNTGMLVRGVAPPGIALLGAPLIGAGPSLIRGRTIAENEIAFAASGVELDFRSLAAEHLFMIAVPEDLLERHAIRLLGRPVTALSRGSRLRMRAGPEELERWFAGLDLARYCRQPATLEDPVTARQLEEKVVDGLLGLLATDERPFNSRGGVRIAKEVEGCLRDHLQDRLTIGDLCAALGVPERTLHVAVRSHLGLSPMALVKTMRLNAVRQALRSAAPGTQVMDIAARWGFQHAGWFSQDYKRQFGESPSQTLRHRMDLAMVAAR